MLIYRGVELLLVASSKVNERCVPAWPLDWNADLTFYLSFIWSQSYHLVINSNLNLA